MKERYYTLDREKVADQSAAHLAGLWGVKRHRVWAWLQGINAIPESYFARLRSLTDKEPKELLTKESLDFFTNLSI